MKEQLNQTGTQFVDLKTLTLNAKIDYITIHTAGKVKLPALDGKPKWSRKNHWKRLTVHDASPTDIDTLISIFGAARIFELEIAIDVRPRNWVTTADREALLQSVMVDLFARGLEPSKGKEMLAGFRAFYRRLDKGYMVRPFNLGLPGATDQLLHGGRHDPVQVKGYWKRRDQGAALPPDKQVARVEVRLGSVGLLGHNLTTLIDMKNFRFRKNLMPYFTHMQGTTRPVRCKKPASRQMLALFAAKMNEYDQEQWLKVGVGAFLAGGKRDDGKVRFKRNIPLNDRIGQALRRLEVQFFKPIFVLPGQTGIDDIPTLARYCAGLEQSPMTVF